MQRQTYFARPKEVDRRWHHVDADGQVVGRLASRIATLLIGKHKPTYTPHIDTGDFVVVTNAAGLRLTGRKGEQKFHLTYSGYPGGQHAESYGELLERAPEKLLRNAVRRMMPKNDLARRQLTKLKIYRGAEHPHAAQKPEPLAV